MAKRTGPAARKRDSRPAQDKPNILVMWGDDIGIAT